MDHLSSHVLSLFILEERLVILQEEHWFVFKTEDLTFEDASKIYEPNRRGLLAISTQPDPDMNFSVAVYPIKADHKIPSCSE